MSISPPSDIVLDVARAADPTRLSEATAKLNRTKPGDAAAFASAMSDVVDAPAVSGPPASGPPPQRRPTGSAEAFQQFEAMTLATMIESAMPDDATSAYGSGTAGSVWKSMMAEQLGKQMAKAGGIGLATQLERSAAAGLLGGGDVNGPGPGVQARSLIISNLERGALKDIRPDAGDDTGIASILQDKT